MTFSHAYFKLSLTIYLPFQKGLLMYYTWYQWLLMFYIFSFFGWIFESAYVSLKKKRFVNRGFLRLPMLPLYGTGAVLLLWITLPFRENLLMVYAAGVVAATVLEYLTGWTMERLFKVKYWDYSNQHFQLNGYICLSSSIAWGFLTIFLTEVILDPISHLLWSIAPLPSILCCAGISVLFGADTVQSVRAALNLAKVLEAMTRMQGELDELQVQMALLRSETLQRVEKAKDAAALRVELLKAQAAAKADQLLQPGELMGDTAQRLSAVVEERRDHLVEKLSSLSQKRRALISNMDFYRKGLLRGNPSASSPRFGAALKELREVALDKWRSDKPKNS